MTNHSLPTGQTGSEGDSEKKKWGYKRQQFDAVISTTRFNGAIDNLVNGTVEVRTLVGILDELNASNQRGRYMAEVLALKQESRRLATAPFAPQVAEFLMQGSRRIPWLSDGLASQMAVALGSAADNPAYLDTVNAAVGNLLLDVDRPLKADTRNYLRALTDKIDATRRLQEARGLLATVPSVYPPAIPDPLANAPSPSPPAVAVQPHHAGAAAKQESKGESHREQAAKAPTQDQAQMVTQPAEQELLPAISATEEVTRQVGKPRITRTEHFTPEVAKARVLSVGEQRSDADEYVELEPASVEVVTPDVKPDAPVHTLRLPVRDPSSAHEPLPPQTTMPSLDLSGSAGVEKDLAPAGSELLDEAVDDVSDIAKTTVPKARSSARIALAPNRTTPGVGAPPVASATASAQPQAASQAPVGKSKSKGQPKGKSKDSGTAPESRGFFWILVMATGGAIAVAGGYYWFTYGDIRAAASSAWAPASGAPPIGQKAAKPSASVSPPEVKSPPIPVAPPASLSPPPPAAPPPPAPAAVASAVPAAGVATQPKAPKVSSVPLVKTPPAPVMPAPVPAPPLHKPAPIASPPAAVKPQRPPAEPKPQPVKPEPVKPQPKVNEAPVTNEPVVSNTTPKPSRTIDDILAELMQVPNDPASIEAKAHEVARIVARSAKADAEHILMRLIPEEVLAGSETVDTRTLEPVRRVVALLLKKVALDKDDSRAAMAIDSLGEWAKSRKHGAAAKLTLDQLAEEPSILSRPKRLRALERVQARLGISNAGE